MNVTILMPMAEQRGGGELMLQQLLQHGRGGSVDWSVIFFEDGPLVDKFEGMNVETHIIETGRLRQVHRFVWAVWKLAQFLRKEEIELVVSWSGKPHLYGGLAALLADVPATWYQLGSPAERHLHPIDRLATLLPAQGIITLSKMGREAQARLWPRRPMRLVHPSVDLDRFDPEQLPSPPEARRRLGLPEEGPLIGIVGRLQRWKGIHVFVDALQEVLREHPNAHGVIVGGRHDMEPEYADEVAAQVAAQGLDEDITLAGFQKNVPEWMQAMDVVVHASDHEPFGIVVIEAMALGKPVVAGAAGGPSEIITEDENGLLAPYGDVETLSDKISLFLRDADLRRAAGEAAHKRAQDFSPEHYAQKFIRAIHSLS